MEDCVVCLSYIGNLEDEPSTGIALGFVDHLEIKGQPFELLRVARMLVKAYLRLETIEEALRG